MNYFNGFSKGWKAAAAALVVAAAFVFAACEDATSGKVSPVAAALKKSTVSDEAGLVKAVNDSAVGTIIVEKNINTDVDLTIKAQKTFVIPQGLEVTVKSLTANAAVTVSVSDSGAGKAASGIQTALYSTSTSGKGVIRVKGTYTVAKNVEFTLKNETAIVFTGTVTKALVDGVLNVESAATVCRESGASVKIEGAGRVKVASGDTVGVEKFAVETVAPTAAAPSVPAAPAAPASPPASGGDTGTGDSNGTGTGDSGETVVDSGPVDWDVQLLEVRNGGRVVVDGSYEGNLQSILSWIVDTGGTSEYVIRLAADQTMRRVPLTNKNITLEGHGAERKITWDSTDALPNVGESDALAKGLLDIRAGSTLTLGENITIDGGSSLIAPFTASAGQASQPMIKLINGGKLIMKSGSKLANAKGAADRSYSPAVLIWGGEFDMQGGKITGTTGDSTVYAVYIFGMNDDISSNKFTMSGDAEISGNTRGVYVYGKNYASGGGNGTFTMKGGTIKDNTDWGVTIEGGSSVHPNTFVMEGGTISGNGAAVYVGGKNIFKMTGGTITGTTDGIKGIYLYTDPKLFINGSVNIQVPIQCCLGASTNGTIYIGDSFSATAMGSSKFNIDLVGNGTTLKKTAYWGLGQPVIKKWNGASESGITQGILDNFTGRRAYSYSGLLTKAVEKACTVPLTLKEANNFGYAQYVPSN
jgi:hypothetical protein